MQKFKDGREFDWDDLLNRAVVIDSERNLRRLRRGFRISGGANDDERLLAGDQHQREQSAAQRVRAALR
jgi:hypothetical protein